jgi:hypothetical protein
MSHRGQRSQCLQGCCCSLHCREALHSPTQGGPLLLLLPLGWPVLAGRSTETPLLQGSASRLPQHMKGTCSTSSSRCGITTSTHCSLSVLSSAIAATHMLHAVRLTRNMQAVSTRSLQYSSRHSRYATALQLLVSSVVQMHHQQSPGNDHSLRPSEATYEVAARTSAPRRALLPPPPPPPSCTAAHGTRHGTPP